MKETGSDEKKPLLKGGDFITFYESDSNAINEVENHHEGGGTFWGSVFTLMTCAVGSGILTLRTVSILSFLYAAFGFSQSGMVLATILLFIMSAITFYSLRLLVICSDITNKSTYQDVSYEAFGTLGITLGSSTVFTQ